MDWEMSAKGLAEDVRMLAVGLLVAMVALAWQADSWFVWGCCAWVSYIALAAMNDARI